MLFSKLTVLWLRIKERHMKIRFLNPLNLLMLLRITLSWNLVQLFFGTISHPACLLCSKAHQFTEHPGNVASFDDDKPLFTRLFGNQLIVAKCTYGIAQESLQSLQSQPTLWQSSWRWCSLHLLTVWRWLLSLCPFESMPVCCQWLLLHLNPVNSLCPRFMTIQTFIPCLSNGHLSPQDIELFSKIPHPYNTDAFEHFLTKHNLLDSYPYLIWNLHHGFPLGTLLIPTHSVPIPNPPLVPKFPDVVCSYLADEFSSNLMSEPFSLTHIKQILQGPIYSCPLIVAEQFQGPDMPIKYQPCLPKPFQRWLPHWHILCEQFY